VTSVRFDPARLARYRRRNRLQAAGLLGAMGLVMVAIADLLAGGMGVLAAVGVAAGVAVFAPRAAPGLVLRVLRARPIDRATAPVLHDRLDLVAARAGLDPSPCLVAVPTLEPMAFSLQTARGPVIGLSTGALETLGLREATAVLAHEVAHLVSGDSAIMALSEIMARLVTVSALLGLGLAAAVAATGAGSLPASVVIGLPVAPAVAMLLQRALARNREFDADHGAVELTGDPEALARALRRIELEQVMLWRRLLPPGVRLAPPALLRTHPETGARIARLRAMTASRVDGARTH